ncbi:ParB/RepB/Spo0J family partition protein [Membranihabitans marinus]|uniref:ParB/RepB/Spo0J family partition protein n=1 Tax=Membranihabitans marinus TaxID=1227546 RepID=UPI001F018689|nr:ParB/RepB/Spo0J family partition protein [Membranihabitans marinus]
MKKKELGKGLQALLSNLEEEEVKDEVQGPDEVDDAEDRLIFTIPISSIEANPGQPRTDFDDDAIKELAQSIQTYGLIQPITIRKLSSNHYQIISGERRFRAAQSIGMERVPAYVRVANDTELLEMALVENIQREDLNPLEISLTYQRLIEECQITHEELSDRIGKNRSTITNYIRLLKLPPEIQKGLKQKQLSMGHARALLSLEHIDEILYVYHKISSEQLSVRATEKLIRDLHKPKPPTTAQTEEVRDPEIVKIEDKLSELFGADVKVTSRDGMKGEIKIKFETPNHLDEILELLDQ